MPEAPASPPRGEPFVPSHPPRPAQRGPFWAGLVGPRSHVSVAGWSQAAFEQRHIRRRVFRFTVHIPLDPASVQRVIQSNAGNYGRPGIVKKLIAPLIGRGLLASDGDLWREQRRIVAASFAPPAVEALVPAFAAAAEERMTLWRPGARDMAAEATATTMGIIADTLFGGDRRLKTDEAVHHISAALAAGGDARIAALLGLPNLAWNRRMREGRRGQRFLRKTLDQLVRERSMSGGEDFLGQVIRELKGRFSDEEAMELAVDNAATFYLAGHETTSNALAWTLYLLSEQPGWQDRCAAESRAALAGGPDGLADRLPALRRVLDEALRLYPPAPRFDREALGPDELAGIAVAPGDIVSIWPWLLHRHRRLWDEPDRFDPDRFLPDRKAEQHRFQYIPFGGGPRVCVGARFSVVEALTILAHWLARWRFEPVPGREVRQSGTVTLRPEGGLPLVLAERR